MLTRNSCLSESLGQRLPSPDGSDHGVSTYFAEGKYEPSLESGEEPVDFYRLERTGKYLAVILRGRAGYELIYITNEAYGLVGYYQLISGKSEKNNCFGKFSSNSRFFRVKPPQIVTFSLSKTPRKKIFPTSKISAQEIRHQFFLIWSNLTIMAHIMGLGNQSESWKIIILS